MLPYSPASEQSNIEQLPSSAASEGSEDGGESYPDGEFRMVAQQSFSPSQHMISSSSIHRRNSDPPRSHSTRVSSSLSGSRSPEQHQHLPNRTPSASSPTSQPASIEKTSSAAGGATAPPPAALSHRRTSLTGTGKGAHIQMGGGNKVVAHMTLEVRGKKIADHCVLMADESKSAAERLSSAVKAHSLLSDASDHEELMDRLDTITLPEHVAAVISLSKVQHPLNYIVFRLLLLYTHTSKCIVMLSKGGVMGVIMDRLKVPQEKEGLKFLMEVLAKVCRSTECRHAGSLAQVAQLDAQVLVRLLTDIDDNTYAHTRLQVLQTLEVMSVSYKGRQALLRSGALYAILDLLSQTKRGASFSKAEIGALSRLKKDLLFWEHSAHMRAI